MRTVPAKVSPTETPTESPTDCPPRDGLWFEERPGRSRPFLARWREPGANGAEGKKRTASFASAAERDRFVAAWEKRRKQFGRAALLARPRDVEVWRLFGEITGGADPLEVARWWVRARGPGGIGLTVAQAYERFCEARQPRGYDTEKHLHLHLGRLCGAIGSMRLEDVMPDHIRAWLAGLVDPETGAAMHPTTLRHHRVSARLLFRTAVAERWTNFNPVDAVKTPASGPDAEREGEVNILTVDEARRLFDANRDALCIGRLALEAFGGLRFTSAARLRREDINFVERGIVMPGAKHKSKRRHYVDGWPENLWAWVQRAPKACWDIPPRVYLELKREAFERAGLKPARGTRAASPVVSGSGETTRDGARQWTEAEAAELEGRRNALRHSFATYHLAAYRNPQLTLYLMTKRSLSSLNHDYRGRATQAAGAAYFGIGTVVRRRRGQKD